MKRVTHHLTNVVVLLAWESLLAGGSFSRSGFAVAAGSNDTTVQEPQNTAPDSVTAVAPETTTVIVTGKRKPSFAKEFPAHVTVLDGAELKQQAQTAQNAGELLSKTIGGFAPASGTRSSYSQTMRGRQPLILIDGVPQNTNRQIGRELSGIDPLFIEQIEVVRGSSAAYGYGATGGILQVLTAKPKEPGVVFKNSYSVGSTVTGKAAEGTQGKVGAVMLYKNNTVAQTFGVSYEKTSGFYDTKGKRIAPDPSQIDESDSASVSAVSQTIVDSLTFKPKLNLSYFRSAQDSSYASDPSVSATEVGKVKAHAIKGLKLNDDPYDEKKQIALAVENQPVGPGQLTWQVYYRDLSSRFYPTLFLQQLFQSRLKAKTQGARLQYEQQLGTAGPQLSLGADYSLEDSEQTSNSYSIATYEATGGKVFEKTGQGPNLSPKMSLASQAFFVQAEYQLPDTSFSVRGGLRVETIRVRINRFTAPFTGQDIASGTQEFAETLPNVGIVKHFDKHTDVYLSYAEGFSVPDIGAQLRAMDSRFSFANSDLKGLKTRTYELGTRVRQAFFSLASSVFYSQSDLTLVPEAFMLKTRRAPENMYGFELEAKQWVTANLTLGESFFIMEGRGESPHDQGQKWLSSYRVSPPKATASIDWQFIPQTTATLGAMHVFERNRTPRMDATEPKVKAYTVADARLQYKAMQSLWTLGIENLFNTDYTTTYSQLATYAYGNTSNLPGRGRSVKISMEYTL